jgi:urease accessory protein
VLAAHRNPIDLLELDDTLDAAIMCTVGRRASVAQGRALLSIWDRSFSAASHSSAHPGAVQALKEFTVLLRSTSSTFSSDLPPASAHLGPLFGAIACILGMSLEQTAYVFMLSHVKALLSAAVRASMFGPYHAQKVLASVGVQEGIREVVDREWETRIEDAGQSVPVMDLWVGRHEMLYSRIFNS